MHGPRGRGPEQLLAVEGLGQEVRDAELDDFARRLVIPHPRTGKLLDITAPLPQHMQQSFNLLGFDTSRYDPIAEAPSE